MQVAIFAFGNLKVVIVKYEKYGTLSIYLLILISFTAMYVTVSLVFHAIGT